MSVVSGAGGVAQACVAYHGPASRLLRPPPRSASTRTTAYDRYMRSTLASLTCVSVLVVGCGDDEAPGGTTTSSGPPPITTTSDTTGVASDSTDGTDDGSTGGSTTAEESSGSTGPGIECGNDAVEGDEVCDGAAVGEETCMTQGFAEGELACLPDCSGYDTRGCLTPVCGDGVAVGRELCDGDDTSGATCRSEGFDSGTLACLEDCTAFDVSGCGECGNNQVDGAETCDDLWLQGEDCFSQGFDSGTLACNVDCLDYDTSGCGLCGNDVIDGTEVCDGVDLGPMTCMGLGFAGGMLGCDGDCSLDLFGCGVMQYDVSAPVVNGSASDRFRGNGYAADGDGVLVEFEVYLDLPAACDLDFYVFEAPAFGGPYTQVQRNTVNAGPGLAYYAAGIPLVPITAGMDYILGVGWNCSATYFWTSDGSFAGTEGGIGLFNENHWDNAYPGASDMYVPPNTGGPNTVYVQRVHFGD